MAAELNLKHDPLPCQAYFLFITHVICCFSALLLHRRLSLGLWWMENDLIFQIIGLIPLLSFIHVTFAEGLMWGSLAISLSIIQTLCLVTLAKQAIWQQEFRCLSVWLFPKMTWKFINGFLWNFQEMLIILPETYFNLGLSSKRS